jgi:hypothetical protein
LNFFGALWRALCVSHQIEAKNAPNSTMRHPEVVIKKKEWIFADQPVLRDKLKKWKLF